MRSTWTGSIRARLLEGLSDAMGPLSDDQMDQAIMAHISGINNLPLKGAEIESRKWSGNDRAWTVIKIRGSAQWTDAAIRAINRNGHFLSANGPLSLRQVEKAQGRANLMDQMLKKMFPRGEKSQETENGAARQGNESSSSERNPAKRDRDSPQKEEENKKPKEDEKTPDRAGK